MTNKVILVGRITQDLEIKTTASGKPRLRFSVAVRRPRVGENGERQSDFVDCVAWEGLATNMAKNLVKGSLVSVEARFQSGTSQNEDGTKRYYTNVVAERVEFLDFRKEQEINKPTQQLAKQPYAQPTQQSVQQPYAQPAQQSIQQQVQQQPVYNTQQPYMQPQNVEQAVGSESGSESDLPF